MHYTGNGAGIRTKDIFPPLDESSMNRVEAVHEAMVALQTPPPLARWNVWLCVLLAVVLVAALMASQNGGIAAVFGRIRQGKSFPGS